MNDQELQEFTIRDGIWDSSTKIATIKRKRHTCIFPETGKETRVTYCNNCGSPFVLDDSSKCAECGY